MKDYQKQAEDFLRKTNSIINIDFVKNGKYFHDDIEERDIYNVSLTRGKRTINFDFGNSLANKGKKPDSYDVLACLTKYDVGTFEDFCSDFGYDEDSRRAEKIYNSVIRQYNDLKTLYNDEEMDLLGEIY